MTDVNIPLLRKAVEWAEVEAQRLDGAWVQWAVAEPSTKTHCGTAFCVAGWTLHEAGWPLERIREDPNAMDEAAQLLGIPTWSGSFSCDHLFDGDNSIEKVRTLAEGYAGERL